MIILVISMLCWGSWANTYKTSGPKWRFELYYFDFAIGAVLAALIAALTFGSMGWDGFSFVDDLRNAGKRQELWGFLAGGIFNLANMLLLGVVAIAGMSVAFPISFGVALVVTSIWNRVADGSGSPLLLAVGCLCLLGSVVANAIAWKTHSINRLVLLAQQGKTKSTKKVFNPKAIILGVGSGVLMGLFNPLLEMARESEIGLGPFGLAFVFGAGMMFTTFVYNLFFMNLPVAGKVLDVAEYFKGNRRNHLLGLAGGAIWMAGTVGFFVVARSEGRAAPGPGVANAISEAAPVIATLFGLIVWKDFEGGDAKVRTFVTAMLVLFVIGGLLTLVAPIYLAR